LDAIISYAERDDVKHAVIVGGGLLGLEAAKAVYDLKTWVKLFFNFGQPTLITTLTVYLVSVSLTDKRIHFPDNSTRMQARWS
jgi:hypothetical protein